MTGGRGTGKKNRDREKDEGGKYDVQKDRWARE